MEALWASAAQFFWWTMFAVCAVGFVAMTIILFCMALYMKDKAKLAETK